MINKYKTVYTPRGELYTVRKPSHAKRSLQDKSAEFCLQIEHFYVYDIVKLSI